MNHPVTSKEALIEAAKNIVIREGFSKLNIRGLARECGISVGAVYNYFPSKADLLFGVTENFWRTAIHQDNCQVENRESFPDFFAEIYESLNSHMMEFQKDFLSQVTYLTQEEKAKGKNMEDIVFRHMKEKFACVLERDKKIRPGVFDTEFGKDEFLDYVLKQLLILLKDKKGGSAFFQLVLKKILY